MGVLSRIYDIFSGAFGIAEMVAIYRLVYGYPISRVRKLIVWMMVFSVLMGFCSVLMGNWIEDMDLLILPLSCMVIFFFSVQRHRIRHMFAIIPVTLAVFVPVGLFGVFIGIFDNDVMLSDRFTGIGELPLLIALGILFMKEKKYAYTRFIRRNERVLIFMTSAFIMMVYMFLAVNNALDDKWEAKAAIWVSLLFMIWFLIQVVIKETYAQQYLEASRFNEQIIETEMQHFEAYKENQEELRRLRHDMKNHLSCIHMLLDQGQHDSGKKYVEDMLDSVSGGAATVHTSNDMVDAIIESKSNDGVKKNIRINVQGRLEGVGHVKPIDWCKIFANAIDNAVEALGRLPESEEKILEIVLRKNENFMLIRFRNCCRQQVQVGKGNLVRSSKEGENHGFGLKNIESAVKKYDGDMRLFAEEASGKHYFTVDILIPVRM